MNKSQESDGGGGRIRTFEVDDGRFTVCSLWPLGNPARGMNYLSVILLMVVEGLFIASRLTLPDKCKPRKGLPGLPHCCGE